MLRYLEERTKNKGILRSSKEEKKNSVKKWVVGYVLLTDIII